MIHILFLSSFHFCLNISKGNQEEKPLFYVGNDISTRQLFTKVTLPFTSKTSLVQSSLEIQIIHYPVDNSVYMIG